MSFTRCQWLEGVRRTDYGLTTEKGRQKIAKKRIFIDVRRTTRSLDVPGEAQEYADVLLAGVSTVALLLQVLSSGPRLAFLAEVGVLRIVVVPMKRRFVGVLGALPNAISECISSKVKTQQPRAGSRGKPNEKRGRWSLQYASGLGAFPQQIPAAAIV